jgi:hypothetical protein
MRFINKVLYEFTILGAMRPNQSPDNRDTIKEEREGMELTKLIEQYERENPGEKAFSGEFGWREKFVLWLASRPTCGVEQRNFLDEVEKKGKYNFKVKVIEISAYSELDQDDFTADLSKVIKGE